MFEAAHGALIGFWVGHPWSSPHDPRPAIQQDSGLGCGSVFQAFQVGTCRLPGAVANGPWSVAWRMPWLSGAWKAVLAPCSSGTVSGKMLGN